MVIVLYTMRPFPKLSKSVIAMQNSERARFDACNFSLCGSQRRCKRNASNPMLHFLFTE